MSPYRSKQLETLPRSVVIEAWGIFGFDAFDIKDTYTFLWGEKPDGEGVILRIGGLQRVPPSAQKKLLEEAGYTIDQWLFAVRRVQAKPG